MKKKNTFKKPVITYEPIVQEKQPFWMHSIEKPNNENDFHSVLGTVILLGIVCAIMLGFIMFGG